MDEVQRLSSDALSWRCDPNQFELRTTDELEDLKEVLGHARALDAVQFGIGMRQQGYNLFVLGPHGMGKRTIVRRLLEQQAGTESTPSDWCYVQNFEQSHKPHALPLPAGRGGQLRQDMDGLVDELRTAIPAALEHGVRAVCDWKSVADSVELAGLARHWRARIVLISRDSTLLDEDTIETLVNQLDCPLGLVR